MRPQITQLSARFGGGGLAATDADRREWPRLDLRLNVEFEPGADAERVESGRTGTTENVSAGGLYFTTSEWQGLQVGRKVDVRLSGLGSYGAGPLFGSLEGRATVLRVDLPDPGSRYARAGVAVQFEERPTVDPYKYTH